MNKIDAIADRWAESQASTIGYTPKSASGSGASSGIVNTRRKNFSTSLMVDTAIKSQMTLTRRRGVSYTAIKKYIAQNYLAAQTNMNKRLRFIKRYILNSLENGKLVRTTGSGISGSFRFGIAKQKLRRSAHKRYKQKRTAAKKRRSSQRRLSRERSSQGRSSQGRPSQARRKQHAAKKRPHLHKHSGASNNSSSSSNKNNNNNNSSSNNNNSSSSSRHTGTEDEGGKLMDIISKLSLKKSKKSRTELQA